MSTKMNHTSSNTKQLRLENETFNGNLVYRAVMRSEYIHAVLGID